MGNSAKIISYSMVSGALLNTEFYNLLPEFLPLKARLPSLKIDLNKPGGCTGCQKKRVEAGLFKEFVQCVQTLSPLSLQKLKDFYHVDKLMVNVVNPTTKAIEFKVL